MSATSSPAWGRCKPIQQAITQGVVSALIDGAMAFIAAGLLLFYSVLLAAISVFAALLHLALVFALFPAMRRRMEEEILARAKEQSHLMETVRAATTVKLLGARASARAPGAISTRTSPMPVSPSANIRSARPSFRPSSPG
jgi:ABC-type bacteriocin/lantibiotic exporter with double-glycine peptidase domain